MIKILSKLLGFFLLGHLIKCVKRCVKIKIPHYLVSEEGLVANFAKIHMAPKNIDTDISA